MTQTGLRSIWIVEASCYIDGTGASTLYYSDAGYNSKPADTPASTHFAPRIASPGSFRRAIFDGGTTFGAVAIGYGVVTLHNPDGALDGLKDYGWGRSVIIKQITALDPSAAAYSTAVTRFVGIISHVEADFDLLRLVIRDELALLDVPLQTDRFAGTSTGASGIEGDENIEGQVKPMAFGGAVRNIAPFLANTSNEIRAWNHDSSGTTKPSAAVGALRNGGATYTLTGTDRANLAAMEAATPTAGQADTCLAESLIRVNGSITAGVTADVTIAAQVTNLLTYSEQFDNAAWTKTRASVTADADTAPDGNATADKIVEDGTAGNTHFASQAGTITAADPVVGSVYLKAAERTRARVSIEGASGTLYVDVNLSAGTLGTATATGSYSGASATIKAAGDYYLVRVLGTTATDTSASLIVYLADSGGSTSYDGDSSSGLYAWGAMLIAASEAHPYIKTTSATVAARSKASAARVAEEVLSEIGYSIDEDSLVALDAKSSARVALYVREEATALEIAQQALDSIGGFLLASNQQTYRVGRFEAPSGTVRKAIAEWEVLDDSGAQIELLPTDDDDTGIPIYRVVLQFDVNWTVQAPGELTTSASQADREEYSQEARSYLTEDTSIQTKHPEAREVVIPTVLEQESDAQTEAARRLTFLKSEKIRLRVPLHWSRAVRDSDGTTPIEIGDYVTLTMGRFGLSSATDFVVLGVEEDYGSGITFLDIVNSDAW